MLEDYADTCDYVALKKSVTEVLDKYFHYNGSGNENKSYNPDFAPQDALDEIASIVGYF
jgi:hypothetical protein